MHPMRLDEMVKVLAIDSISDFRFSPEKRLRDPRDVLTTCYSLASGTATAETETTKTTGAEVLRLAHCSVENYLPSERLKRDMMRRYHDTALSANVFVAKTFLAYLHFESPTIWTAKSDHEFSFIRYAAAFWARQSRYISNVADREAVASLEYM